MTNPIALITDNKQLVTTAAVAVAAFLAALPVGATVMPQASSAKTDAVVKTVTRTASATVGSCVADESDVASATSSVKSASTTTHSNKVTSTHTHTDTQTSSNNSGSTAQVGHNGIAAAVTVGDVLSNNNVPVLSNNNVSVPVLSNNATTVSPSVSLLSNNSNGGLLGLGVLGL